MSEFSPHPDHVAAFQQSLDAKLPIRLHYESNPELSSWSIQEFIGDLDNSIIFFNQQLQSTRHLSRRFDILRCGDPIPELARYLEKAEAAFESASGSRTCKNFASNQVRDSWQNVRPSFAKAKLTLAEYQVAALELNAREGAIGRYEPVGNDLASFKYRLFADQYSPTPINEDELFGEGLGVAEGDDAVTNRREPIPHQVDILCGAQIADELVSANQESLDEFRSCMPIGLADHISVISGSDVKDTSRAFAGVVVLDAYLLGTLPEEGFGLLSISEAPQRVRTTILKAFAPRSSRRNASRRGKSLRDLLGGSDIPSWLLGYTALLGAGFGVGQLLF